MRHREPVKPSIDLPLSAALEELTGFECIGIRKRFGRDVTDLGVMEMLVAVVHAYENRDGQSVSWQAVEAKTVRELQGYFEQEPVEPENETGKGFSGEGQPTAS